MKVQGAGSSIYPIRDNEASTVKKDNKLFDAKNSKENPVQVNISDEGYECYRKSLSAIEESLTSPSEDNSESTWEEDKLVQDVVTEHYSGIRNLVNELCVMGGETVENRAKGYLYAYAITYDKIIKGYEDGTREAWSHKDGEEARKLTKEEDLAALDELYKKMVEDFEKGVKANLEIAKDRLELEKEIAKIRGYNVNERGIVDLEKIIKNNTYKNGNKIAEYMLKASEKFRANYALNPDYASDKEKVLKETSLIIDEIFDWE